MTGLFGCAARASLTAAMAAIAVSVIETAMVAAADKRSTGASPLADVPPNPAARPNCLLPILHATTALAFGGEVQFRVTFASYLNTRDCSESLIFGRVFSSAYVERFFVGNRSAKVQCRTGRIGLHRRG